jgi:hypothetical protein
MGDIKHVAEFIWKKGQSGNPNGRPKKFVSKLVDEGYKLSEVNDCIMAMLAMNLDELKAVFQDENATILEKTIAQAMKKSLEKGSLYTVETLMTRLFGAPKTQIESKNENINKNVEIKVITSEMPLASSEGDIKMD